MNAQAFALARATLRLALDWGFRRTTIPSGTPRLTRSAYRYGPGRFEGEHWSIVYWHDRSLSGDHGEEFYCADMLECEVFEPDETERAAFGIDAGKFVVLQYSTQGFVTMHEIGQGALDEMRDVYADIDRTNTLED